jgi:GTPase SAR1 family protein
LGHSRSERYQSVSQLFYRDTNVALVCFEAGAEDSTNDVPDWVSRVKKEVPEADIILVGTKGDLIENEGEADKIVTSVLDTFAEIQPKGCFVTSARTGDRVEALFQRAAELYAPAQEATRQVRKTQDIAAGTATSSSCCQ